MDREGAIAPAFPPLQIAQIVALACSPPAHSGLWLQAWTCRSLQVQAIKDGIVTSIHYSTICLILQKVDLQPHRTLYWKHPTALDFEEKAAGVLWYYERAESLHVKGDLVFCLDEKTQIQALSPARPDLPARPGCPLRRDHEYVRHGTANLLLVYNVADGTLWGDTPSRTNSNHFQRTLEKHIRRHPKARRIHYILDGAPSHTSHSTQKWLKRFGGRVRFHFTPAHASWMNMAELALSTVSRKYLRGGRWISKPDLQRSIKNSLHEYNRLFAHPFHWTFSRRRMHDWHHLNRCQIRSTRQ